MTALVDQPPAPPAPGWSPVRAAVGRAEAALGEAVDWALWSLGEADARDVLTADGATSSAAFLRHRLRLSPSQAAACAKTARATRTVAMETGAACAAGRVTGAQATVITRAVG